MKKRYIFALVLLCLPFLNYAQVAINTDGSDPHPSTILDISSTSAGVLFPRMTTAQMLAIPNPPDYMMIINTDEGEICFFNPKVGYDNWLPVDSRGVISGSGYPTSSVSITSLYFNELNNRFYVYDGAVWNMVVPDDDDWEGSGNDLYSLPTGNVGIGTSSPQEKLHVEGSIRMVDGNQAAGYVMTSDADGTAFWADASSFSGSGYTMQWGGEIEHNSYAQYGASASTGETGSSSYKTKGVVPAKGNISTVSWSSEDADATSTIRILVNGTASIVNLTGSIGHINLVAPIAVLAGDVLEIKGGSSGREPEHCTITLYID